MSDGFDDLLVVITRSETGVLVRVTGDVDLASVGALRSALDGQLDGTTGDVEVDASGISFCDSVGLGALLRARETLREAGRSLRLVDASPSVRRLLQITSTGALFGVELPPLGPPDGS